MQLDQITSFLHGQSDTKITFCKICKDNLKKSEIRDSAQKLMTALQDNWLGLSANQIRWEMMLMKHDVTLNNENT